MLSTGNLVPHRNDPCYKPPGSSRGQRIKVPRGTASSEARPCCQHIQTTPVGEAWTTETRARTTDHRKILSSEYQQDTCRTTHEVDECAVVQLPSVPFARDLLTVYFELHLAFDCLKDVNSMLSQWLSVGILFTLSTLPADCHRLGASSIKIPSCIIRR